MNGSQKGAICASRWYLIICGDIFWLLQLEGGGCFYYLVGRAQGCCLISYNVKEPPPHTHFHDNDIFYLKY